MRLKASGMYNDHLCVCVYVHVCIKLLQHNYLFLMKFEKAHNNIIQVP